MTNTESKKLHEAIAIIAPRLGCELPNISSCPNLDHFRGKMKCPDTSEKVFSYINQAELQAKQP